MHSSRMRTDRHLTVSLRRERGRWVCLGVGSVSGQGGGGGVSGQGWGGVVCLVRRVLSGQGG